MRVLVSAVAIVVQAVLFVPQASAATPATQTDMQLAQNELRYSVGAPTIPAMSALMTAAQSHATYNAMNGVTGHYETAGLPGYTGYAPRDRAIAAGYGGPFVSEVATGSADPLAGVRSLWDAPYHRLGMLHPNAFAVGWGRAQTTSSYASYQVVGDFAYDFGMATVDVVRSPAAGQSGIPASWNGRESPSPVPAGSSGPYGYPIMAVWSGGRSVDLRGASLSANGSAIAFTVAPQQFERDYVVLVPTAPLPLGTVSVRLDVTVAGTPRTEQWSFSTTATAPTVPVAGAPPASAFHSAFLAESPWPTIAAGETTTLTLLFRNAGTAAWRRGTATEARLGVNGDDRTFASLGMAVGWPIPDRPAVQDVDSVAPGATTTFTFRVKGTQRGTFTLHLRPVVDGLTWMEDEGVYMVVAVR